MKKNESTTVNTTTATETTATETTATAVIFADITARIAELQTAKTVEVITSIKEQKDAIIKAAETSENFSTFCEYLKSVNYCITLNKKILVDVGKMPVGDYDKLTNSLTLFRYCLTEYTRAKIEYEIEHKKANKIALDNARNKCFTCLKHLKSIFNIESKCAYSDIELIAAKSIGVKYVDRFRISAGYRFTPVGNLTILNNLMKVISASNNSQISDINSEMLKNRKTVKALASSCKELTNAIATENATENTTENITE